MVTLNVYFIEKKIDLELQYEHLLLNIFFRRLCFGRQID